MNTVTYQHACRQGGPAQLPVTWDRINGGARVSCPMCGVNKLTAAMRTHVL